MLDLLLDIKEIIVIVLTSIGAILILISKISKSNKIKKIAENFLIIEDSIIKYMFESENFYSFKGKEKKEWVKTKINQFCIYNNLAYDDQSINETIEKVIQISKNINKREKDMESL